MKHTLLSLLMAATTTGCCGLADTPDRQAVSDQAATTAPAGASLEIAPERAVDICERIFDCNKKFCRVEEEGPWTSDSAVGGRPGEALTIEDDHKSSRWSQSERSGNPFSKGGGLSELQDFLDTEMCEERCSRRLAVVGRELDPLQCTESAPYSRDCIRFWSRRVHSCDRVATPGDGSCEEARSMCDPKNRD